MRIFAYILILLLPAFLISQSSIEIGFGHHKPQGYFDKYNDSGFSFRGTYSKIDIDKPHIRYDFSFQLLQFRSDSWLDNSVGYPVTITNSEQSLGFLFGPRLMSPTSSGALRPYIGLKGGLFIFSETMSWEWATDYDNSIPWLCILFDILDDDDDWDCDNDDGGSVSETLDSKFNFGAIFEMGANMKINNNWGFDFGIQYNLIPSLKSSYEIIGDEIETEEGNILNIGQISKTINADYATFYFGVHFNINPN